MIIKKWTNPRQEIAGKYANNDFAYVTTGALGAINSYAMLNIPPSISKTMLFLDYGCGTGRMSRVLTPLYKGVFGYDPSENCIQEGNKENILSGVNYPNLKLTTDINEIPQCDVGCCISVLEHLSEFDANILIQNLIDKIRGDVIVTYSVYKNFNIISPFLTDAQIEEDRNNNIQVRVINFNCKLN